MNLKDLNYAESFAMVRVLSFPLVLFCMLLEERTLSAWLYISLFSTDFIDGIFALFFKQESDRRAKLDSLGDVLFLLSGLVGFYIFETNFFLEHIKVIGLVVGLYGLQVIIALVKWGRPTSFHTLSAKLAGATQAVFFAFTFFFEVSTVFFYWTVVLSILEVIEEILLTLLLPNWKANIKGLLWLKNQKNKKSKKGRTNKI